MARRSISFAALLVISACAQAEDAPRNDAEIFIAAGYHLEGSSWKKCDDPGTMSYSPGAISDVGDLNGDGSPELVVSEGSSYCYGMTGTAFTLVTREGAGWKAIIDSPGIPLFLESKGKDGWPDVEVGGPGFCFAKLHWNGEAYSEAGFSYEGKPCKP